MGVTLNSKRDLRIKTDTSMSRDPTCRFEAKVVQHLVIKTHRDIHSI